MRAESHRRLGIYLANHYLSEKSSVQIRAFLLGCIEPDRNPATYLKGSIRYQWLRGHNFPNTVCFMQRISKRLENKEKWSVLEYYTLGKLIHYISDAFTLAHNAKFPTDIRSHQNYERTLQSVFLKHIKTAAPADVFLRKNTMESIFSFHDLYKKQHAGYQTDAFFTLFVCSSVMFTLTHKHFLKTASRPMKAIAK